MRLVTITNWAYCATVALTIASGATMLLASSAQEQERSAVAQRDALNQATASVDEDVVLLSGLARQFAISGDPADHIAYDREGRSLSAVEERTRLIRDAGATAAELNSLHMALHWTDALRGQQHQALSAKEEGDKLTAIGILFSPEYQRELDRCVTAVQQFQEDLNRRTDLTLRTATQTSRLWRTMSEATLAITGLLFLGVLSLVFRRRVLQPVVKLSDVVGRLAANDFGAEPPSYDHVDEIGDMAQALRVFRETGLERQRLERERDSDRTIRDLLSRMTQRMQSCDTVSDLGLVVQRFVPEIAPQFAGTLYLLDAERNAVVEACSWQDPAHSRSEFSSLACWALRRGAPHRLSTGLVDVPCEHIERSGEPNESICLPLSGQQGTLGLLYLERGALCADAAEAEPHLDTLAENIGLALDNLRLRDALRSLAMADPLTKLANRRELDRELKRQIARSELTKEPLSCLMIDVDHFKRFNDDHGHDAGDAVLRSVGALLKGSVRDGRMVFRYGGEEFLILLTGMSVEQGAKRAEDIRLAISQLEVAHEGRNLGAVTASIGLASFPEHCEPSRLMQAADAALLRAKQAGRNQVLVAHQRHVVQAA
jgi:diguanylate cyclase (GGDEF)-like protein